ncbi:MAG: HEAT repeat domain-containing protein [Planctomycetota bacterium]|jgi:hypothetical protein
MKTNNNNSKRPQTKWEVIALLAVICATVVFGYKIRRKMLLSNYVRMIRSDSDVVVKEGIAKLSRLCPYAAPALMEVARNKSENWIVRKNALQSMYDSADDECITRVTNSALAPQDRDMQWAVINVLSVSGDVKNLPVVRNVHHKSEFREIRMKALRLYGRFPIEAIAEDLINTIKDTDVGVALEALHVLETATREEFGDFHDAMAPSRLNVARDETVRNARIWWVEYRNKQGPSKPR